MESPVDNNSSVMISFQSSDIPVIDLNNAITCMAASGITIEKFKSVTSNMTALTSSEINFSREDNQRESAFEQLKEENFVLKAKVSDLTGALKAREMELINLLDRFNRLKQAVEQQDAVIAEIYAATSPSSIALEEYCAIRQSSLALSNIDHCNASPSCASFRNFSKSLLRNHLDSMGFNSAKVNEVLFELSADGNNSAVNSRQDSEILNAALDKLLGRGDIRDSESTAMIESSNNVSNECGNSHEQEHEISSEMTKQTTPPHNLGLATFDGWENRSSAAFLRHTNRRPRRSVSDYGLLSLESPGDSDAEDSKTQASDHTFHRKYRRSSAMLFEGIGDISASEIGNTDVQDKAKFAIRGEICELTYNQFLDRLGRPASRDLLDMIRRFVGSVAGPNGDGSPPGSKDYIDYEFYGNRELAKRCASFFDTMDHRLKEHPAWCYASEATLVHARDGIEKYVMEKLACIAMNCNAAWKEEDDRLLQRMRLLSFVTPDMLDVNPCVRNEVVWSIAEDELRKINCFKSPGDKINCIVRCCSIVFSVLNLSRGDGTNRPGADDFLPVFIYIVLKACVPHLYSNCEYIANYRNKADLMSKAGYCFVNLRSAIEFISVLEPTMLTVDPIEFNRKLAQAEREYGSQAITLSLASESVLDMNKTDVSP